jgi:hypothetical protein
LGRQGYIGGGKERPSSNRSVAATSLVPASPHDAVFISIKILQICNAPTILAINQIRQEAFIDKEGHEVKGIVGDGLECRQRIFHGNNGAALFCYCSKILDSILKVYYKKIIEAGHWKGRKMRNEQLPKGWFS